MYFTASNHFASSLCFLSPFEQAPRLLQLAKGYARREISFRYFRVYPTHATQKPSSTMYIIHTSDCWMSVALMLLHVMLNNASNLCRCRNSTVTSRGVNSTPLCANGERCRNAANICNTRLGESIRNHCEPMMKDVTTQLPRVGGSIRNLCVPIMRDVATQLPRVRGSIRNHCVPEDVAAQLPELPSLFCLSK